MDFVDSVDSVDSTKSTNSAYFGKKGYTILKNELSIRQQNMIRDDLPYLLM